MRLLQAGFEILCRLDSREKPYYLRFLLPKSSVSGNKLLQPGKYLITPATLAASDPFFSFWGSTVCGLLWFLATYSPFCLFGADGPFFWRHRIFQTGQP
jgi:hypothetical protein